MAIIRLERHENPYVILDKAGLEDSRLSWKAKGLLAYLLSRPRDWQVHIRELVTHAGDGEEATRSGLQELQRYGYAEFHRWHDAEGKLDAEWVIYELPHGDFPHVEKPHVDKPHEGKPDGENRQATKDRLTKDRTTEERGRESARPRAELALPPHPQTGADPRPAPIRILAEITRMTPAPHGTPWNTVCAAVPEGDPQALDRWRQTVTAGGGSE